SADRRASRALSRSSGKIASRLGQNLGELRPVRGAQSPDIYISATLAGAFLPRSSDDDRVATSETAFPILRPGFRSRAARDGPRRRATLHATELCPDRRQ